MTEGHIFNDCEPILLTEEWLDKFSHCALTEKTKKGLIVVDRFKLIWKPEYNYWYVLDFMNDTYITKVEFVHEWQNVYFSLNGKELTIKHY